MTIKGNIDDFREYLHRLIEKHEINSNFSDDGLISLFKSTKDLRDEVKDHFYPALKGKLQQRAIESGVYDEKDRPSVVGDERYISFYDKGWTEVDESAIMAHFAPLLMETKSRQGVEEILSEIFSLVKGWYIGKLRKTDIDALEKVETNNEDGNYWVEGNSSDFKKGVSK